MTISNIVCRSGVGPTATIPLFVTHGLSIGAAVESQQYKGWIPKRKHDDDGYKAQKARLEAEIADKKELLADIRRQMEPELEKQQAQQVKKGKKRQQFYPSIELQNYLKEQTLLTIQLQNLAEQLANLDILYKRRDNEEAAAILLLLG